MDKDQLVDQLEELKAELEEVTAMTEEDVCEEYGADSKQDIINCIQEDITPLQKELEEIERLEEGSGMDYVALQLSQGLPVIYW